jgi:MATE family multidrug resistance protein
MGKREKLRGNAINRNISDLGSRLRGHGGKMGLQEKTRIVGIEVGVFRFVQSLKSRWSEPDGYRAVLTIALPLVLSTGSHSVLQFIDRMFLAKYSTEALAASMPAGLTSFCCLCFFFGTASYANTFVAQYHGAGQHGRVGAVVWQALYFSLAAGICGFFLFPQLALPLFGWAGHEPAVMKEEVTYFQVLSRGAGFVIYNAAIASFFSGRGKTWPILWVDVVITVVNIVLSYAWIFGKWGFPEQGIAGAGRATVVATAIGSVIFTALFLSERNRREFGTASGWRFNWPLMRRLLHYGSPAGVQHFLDIVAFTLFLLMVGRLGEITQAATNLSFQVNLLVCLPMLGIGMATATLVGRRIGKRTPAQAARITWSSFHLTFGYMLVFAALYIAVPGWFLEPFHDAEKAGEFEQLRPVAVVLLRFVAIYSVFDTMSVIFSSALKGAGDTRFVMWYSMSLGWALMVLPSWWICSNPGPNAIYWCWTWLSVYVLCLGCGYVGRFLQGRWRSMRVIEEEAVPEPGVEVCVPVAGLTGERDI